MRRWLVAFAVLAAAGAARAQKITPKEVVANMEATWARTEAYSCREDAWSKAGSTEKTQAFDFMFRKPRLIKLKVQAEPHKGADVIYRDGKIRAAERILGIRMKKGMKASEPDFYSARGVPFWEADMGSQIESIKAILPKADASAERARSGGEIYVYLTLKWKGEDPKLRKGAHTYVTTYKLDSKSWFPVERITTEDGAKVEEITRTNVNLHPNLPESAFNL